MTKKSRIWSNKTAIGVLMVLAFITRTTSFFSSKIPWGHDPYLFGGATVNLINEWSIPGALPYGTSLSYYHLESILFLIFLVPFKFVLGDMVTVLKFIPGILGAIDVFGLYLFVTALTKEDSIAFLSAFFLAFNPYHSSTTSQEGLALGLLFFSMYLLLKNKPLFSGFLGGLILLTDYMIFGHFLLVLTIYFVTYPNKKNYRDVIVVILFAFLTSLPWQLYLNSISKVSSFTGNIGSVQPQSFLVFDPQVVADTIYVLPHAITPINVFFVVGGLYFLRKKQYFPFLSISFIIFLILSFINIASLGVQPSRHVISLSVFSSVISAVFLDSIKIKKILFVVLILLSILMYFSYSINHFVEIPNETLITSKWISGEEPNNVLISAPTVVYAVFSGKTVLYEPDPCNNRKVDYIIEDRNLQRYPISYGRKGKILNIKNYSCLNLVYSTENIDVYRVIKRE
jgi:hypothetical protein